LDLAEVEAGLVLVIYAVAMALVVLLRHGDLRLIFAVLYILTGKGGM
jgi:hypothetical protein